jgi:hypothetical protein
LKHVGLLPGPLRDVLQHNTYQMVTQH